LTYLLEDLSFAFIFMLLTWVLLKKKKAENSQNMATNIRLFLNYCNKILLNVNVSTSFTLFTYILCIFVSGLVEKKHANSKKMGNLFRIVATIA